MTRNATTRSLVSALAVALGTVSLAAVPVAPVSAQEQPEPARTPIARPVGNQGPVVRVEGGTFDNRKENTIPFTVDDPQGDDIYQVWWYPIPGATLEYVEDNRWAVRLAKGAKAGQHDLRLWAIDAHGNKGNETRVKVTITDGNPQPAPVPVPDPDPGVNNGPVIQVSGGTYDNRQRNVIPFKAVDPEGDWVSRVWWYPLPNGSLRHVDGDNWEIVLEPGVRPGDYPLRIWAADNNGNEGAKSNVNIRIVGDKVNAAPVIYDGSVTMWGGYPFNYKVPVHDPDGDKLNIRIVEGEPWISVVDGNHLRLAPGKRNVGHFRVVVEATDGKETVRGTYNIYVKPFN